MSRLSVRFRPGAPLTTIDHGALKMAIFSSLKLYVILGIGAIIGIQQFLYQRSQNEIDTLLEQQGRTVEQLKNSTANNASLLGTISIKESELASLKEAIRLQKTEYKRVVAASTNLKEEFKKYANENKKLSNWLNGEFPGTDFHNFLQGY